jgi:hypothetical protein
MKIKRPQRIFFFQSFFSAVGWVWGWGCGPGLLRRMRDRSGTHWSTCLLKHGTGNNPESLGKTTFEKCVTTNKCSILGKKKKVASRKRKKQMLRLKNWISLAVEEAKNCLLNHHGAKIFWNYKMLFEIFIFRRGNGTVSSPWETFKAEMELLFSSNRVIPKMEYWNLWSFIFKNPVVSLIQLRSIQYMQPITHTKCMKVDCISSSGHRDFHF